MKRSSNKTIIFILFLGFFFLSNINLSEFEKNSRVSFSIEHKIGHYLFFDRDLSSNQTKSCASCHNPNLIFTDGYDKSLGLQAAILPRNTPSLINVSERHFLNLANPNITTLEDQMDGPLFNTSPKEMGVKGHETEILERLNKKYIYKNLLVALPNHPKLNFENIKKYIATYLKSLNSHHSKFDDYQCNLNDNALSAIEKEGMELFFSERLGCGNCHNGINLDTPLEGEFFANTGLYNINQSYPPSDLGVQNISHSVSDNGKFRIPSLKNVALTHPYYHDGSTMTLSEVIQTYENGGRNITKGDNIGDGRLHPNKDKRLKTFKLTKSEKKSLLAFLYSLNDTQYLKNSNFKDPFEQNITH